MIKMANASLAGLFAPIFEEGLHLMAGGLIPEFAQFLFQVPAEQERFVQLEGLVEFRNLILF